MQTKFHGVYAPYIDQFVTLKKQLGFKYTSEEYLFSLFDKFTINRGEKTVGITKELAEEWSLANTNDSDSFRHKKASCLNQLSSFLTKQRISSYILQLPRYKYSFCPYIYTKQEIDAIFIASDNLALHSGLKSIIICIPALVRLLYGTRLRIGEALSLKNRDINLDENYLVVRDSKNGQERMIPISTSLSEVCKEYVANRNKIPVARSD